MSDTVPPKKIAILGGGVGAMTAAYELTEVPGWQDRYEITVYQMGWRLGGKGASGRNQSVYDRIEEHGLHLWFGYYENAFGLMQRRQAKWAESLAGDEGLEVIGQAVENGLLNGVAWLAGIEVGPVRLQRPQYTMN